MTTYRVRLTIEGEHHEQDVGADDALHAIRQALVLWHNHVPEEAVVVTARKVHL